MVAGIRIGRLWLAVTNALAYNTPISNSPVIYFYYYKEEKSKKE
jgi:hypothetical protein